MTNAALLLALTAVYIGLLFVAPYDLLCAGGAIIALFVPVWVARGIRQLRGESNE